MHSPDRYALAIDMLAGDRDARKILADLLEEQGDRGLAQWAKGGGNAKHRRLDFALMLLPTRTAVCLAVEFMEHAFTATADAALHRSLSMSIRQWRQRESTAGEVAANFQMLIAAMPPGWGFRPRGARSTGIHNSELKAAIGSLAASVEAAATAELAANCAATSGTPRHWNTLALQHLRALATACQNQARPKRSPASVTQPSAEVQWQIERTRALFQHLLTAQDDSWPK